LHVRIIVPQVCLPARCAWPHVTLNEDLNIGNTNGLRAAEVSVVAADFFATCHWPLAHPSTLRVHLPPTPPHRSTHPCIHLLPSRLPGVAPIPVVDPFCILPLLTLQESPSRRPVLRPCRRRARPDHSLGPGIVLVLPPRPRFSLGVGRNSSAGQTNSVSEYMSALFALPLSSTL
jgi:hypothetical protein